MPKFSDWVIQNAVFYLQLKLKSSEYNVNFDSFVYDTSIRECHTLTINIDYSHKDLPKFIQVNIAFPEDPEYLFAIEKEVTKQSKKSPGVVKLIIRRDYKLAKLIDYAHAFICHYLNNPNYLSYLSSPVYVQPWKIHWPNKDNTDPVLICEAKLNDKPLNDVKESREKFIQNIKIAQENMWAIMTHQEPPDMSMPFRLSSTGDILLKGDFPIDNIILKLEQYSLQLLHEEYLALLNKQAKPLSHKRPKTPQSVATSAATASKSVDTKLSLSLNSEDDEKPPSRAITNPPKSPIFKPAAAASSPQLTLFYHFTSDEESDDATSQKSKKSKPVEKSDSQEFHNQDKSTSNLTSRTGLGNK